MPCFDLASMDTLYLHCSPLIAMRPPLLSIETLSARYMPTRGQKTILPKDKDNDNHNHNDNDKKKDKDNEKDKDNDIDNDKDNYTDNDSYFLRQEQHLYRKEVYFVSSKTVQKIKTETLSNVQGTNQTKNTVKKHFLGNTMVMHQKQA